MKNDYKESFKKTREAGIIAAGALEEVSKIIKPGLRTEEIDKLCYEYFNDHGAYSAPLFYRGFPKSCCTSPNHTVCHGIPTDKILKEGTAITIKIRHGINVHNTSTATLCVLFEGFGFLDALNLIQAYAIKNKTKTLIATIIGNNNLS